jgi:hypothetical protein
MCPKQFSEPMVRSTQTVHISCVKISTISKYTKTSMHLSHVTKIGASKTIPVPMVRLAQTVHLSCTHTTTVSEWIEMRFHMNKVI